MTTLARRGAIDVRVVPPTAMASRPFLNRNIAYSSSQTGQFIDHVRLVPVVQAPQVVRFSVGWFEDLARHAPATLLAAISAREVSLDHVLLSRAAQALALVDSRRPEAVEALLRLLEHERPFVREAALIGIAPFVEGHATARQKVESMSMDDPSPGVREAAGELLMVL